MEGLVHKIFNFIAQEENKPLYDAIEKIKIACKKNNKKIGIHCLSATYLNQKFQEGFDLATIGTDLRFFVEIVGNKLSEINYE